MFGWVVSGMCGVVLLAGGLKAQDIGTANPVGKLDESYLTAAQVSSSRILIGVAPALGDMIALAENRPSAYVVVPDELWESHICARWLALDALYAAQGTFRLPERPGAGDGGRAGVPLARLNYAPEHAERVEQIPPGELGLAVTAGACEDDTPLYLPALWNLEPPSNFGALGGEVVVMVNTGAADDAWLRVDSPETEQFLDCVRLDGPATQGADFLCPVQLDAVPEEAQFELNRVRRGQPLDPVRFRIARSPTG
jgi:hypothetical protein